MWKFFSFNNRWIFFKRGIKPQWHVLFNTTCLFNKRSSTMLWRSLAFSNFLCSPSRWVFLCLLSHGCKVAAISLGITSIFKPGKKEEGAAPLSFYQERQKFPRRLSTFIGLNEVTWLSPRIKKGQESKYLAKKKGIVWQGDPTLRGDFLSSWDFWHTILAIESSGLSGDLSLNRGSVDIFKSD